MIYLISYPRSGNTAMRYILELLTGQPSNGLCGEPNPRDKLQQPLIHGGDDYCVHKRHDFEGVEPEIDTVIFIIRDPLEAVIRHNELARGIDTVEKMRGYLDGWFRLLLHYDQFSGNKMLIRYENLIKVADRASLDIYPNPQSADPDHHKSKLSNGLLMASRLHMKEKYSYLYHKYLG